MLTAAPLPENVWENTDPQKITVKEQCKKCAERGRAFKANMDSNSTFDNYILEMYKLKVKEACGKMCCDRMN